MQLKSMWRWTLLSLGLRREVESLISENARLGSLLSAEREQKVRFSGERELREALSLAQAEIVSLTAKLSSTSDTLIQTEARLTAENQGLRFQLSADQKRRMPFEGEKELRSALSAAHMEIAELSKKLAAEKEALMKSEANIHRLWNFIRLRNKPVDSTSVKSLLDKLGSLTPILLLLGMCVSVNAQPMWRNFFTTNQNPRVTVQAGSNATVQASTVGVDQRIFTVNASYSSAGIISTLGYIPQYGTPALTNLSNGNGDALTNSSGYGLISMADTNWVLSQISSLGVHIYSSGITNTGALDVRTNNWQGLAGVPATVTTNTVAAVANAYVRHVVSTQAFTRVESGPISITAYLYKSVAGTVSISPEIYVWEGGTLTEIASAPAQAITGTSVPEIYQWSVSIPASVVATNTFQIVWAWKVIALTATPTLSFVSGGAYDSHLAFSQPFASVVAGDVYSKSNNVFTGSNNFTQGITATGQVHKLEAGAANTLVVTNGRVGIGKVNPGYTLDVVGACGVGQDRPAFNWVNHVCGPPDIEHIRNCVGGIVIP